jgi:hypothetical protein
MAFSGEIFGSYPYLLSVTVQMVEKYALRKILLQYMSAIPKLSRK